MNVAKTRLHTLQSRPVIESGAQSLWQRERLYVLSWEKLGVCLEKIKDDIIRSDFKPTTIVTIARGGLIPATYLSHVLGIESFEILGIARNAGDDTFSAKREPELIWTSSNRDYFGGTVLLVDDVSGEGKTLSFAADYLISKGAAQIKTAVIVKIEKSRFAPDYTAVELNDWIIFPWEKPAHDESLELQPVAVHSGTEEA